MNTATVAIEPAIAEKIEEIIAFRHDLHEHPELGMTEVRTAKKAADFLRAVGCDEVVEGVGKTGVVALIRGNKPSERVLGYRADMDALPLVEKTGVPWTSCVAGMHHGCGHDGHVAMAMALAAALAADRNFAGTAMIVIQPGEEGFAGAREMIRDGLFSRWHVDEMYGTHGGVELEAGRYGFCRGVMTSAADRFLIEITGVGGHGARPHQCIDPVVVAGHLIVAMQTIPSRSVDPMHPAVVTIASVHAGSEDGVSVVPMSVRLAGTTRCHYAADRDTIERRMKEICEGLALEFGAQIRCDFIRMYPPLVNADAQLAALQSFFEKELGREAVEPEFPPSMGAEDFAFMLEEKPGAYIRTGMRDQSHQAGPHHPGFDFNDKVIAPTASLFARFFRARLNELSGRGA